MLLPIVILAAGIAVWKVAGILRPAPKREIKTAGPPRVRTVVIEPWQDVLTLDVDGSVVPFREVSVTAEVAGRIINKSETCQVGKSVQSGALLFEVNPIDFSLKVDQLNKEVRQAEISLHQLDVEMENYRSLIDLAMEDAQLQSAEVGRLERMVAERASSRSELDKSRSVEISSRNSLEKLKNDARLLVTKRMTQQSAIEVATSKLEQAELDWKRTKITSPIDGVIVKELVQKDAFVPVGTTLVTIDDTSSVEVVCNLRSEHLYQLWESRGPTAKQGSCYELPRVPATVIYQVAGKRFAWDGRLDRYDGLGMDPRTRTTPVRVVVENPRVSRCLDNDTIDAIAPALIRGMYVTVSLQLDTQTRELAKLPVSAIRPGNAIYRYVDGKLKIENVNVARMTDEFAILETDGAAFIVGDRVITTPIPSPEDGMRVDRSDKMAARAEIEEKFEGGNPIDIDAETDVDSQSDSLRGVEASP